MEGREIHRTTVNIPVPKSQGLGALAHVDVHVIVPVETQEERVILIVSDPWYTFAKWQGSPEEFAALVLANKQEGRDLYEPEAEPEPPPSNDNPVIPDPHADSNGTSLVGALEPIKYPQLVAKIGEPHRGVSGDNKVDAEWFFQTPAGVATIYNYKSGPAYNPGTNTRLEDVDDWHIGGHSREVVEYIQQYVASR